MTRSHDFFRQTDGERVARSSPAIEGRTTGHSWSPGVRLAAFAKRLIDKARLGGSGGGGAPLRATAGAAPHSPAPRRREFYSLTHAERMPMKLGTTIETMPQNYDHKKGAIFGRPRRCC